MISRAQPRRSSPLEDVTPVALSENLGRPSSWLMSCTAGPVISVSYGTTLQGLFWDAEMLPGSECPGDGQAVVAHILLFMPPSTVIPYVWILD